MNVTLLQKHKRRVELDEQLEQNSLRLRQRISRILERNRERRVAAVSAHQKPKRKILNRDRAMFELIVMQDYFSQVPRYDATYFRRRFRMQRELFERIVKELEAKYTYFKQKKDATGKTGFHPFIKGTAAMRMLAYGGSADAVDEYLKMADSTSRECLVNFCQGIIECFGEEYLREPNEEDLKQLLALGEARGFPGMLGSLDCMHWQWKNCPTGWAGMYTSGKEGAPTVILEAVASHDMWIWHSFFGVPGSCNDLNVLHKSPLFDNVINGHSPAVSFTVNNNQYDKGYYLADGIYPTWATLVKTIRHPIGNKHKV